MSKSKIDRFILKKSWVDLWKNAVFYGLGALFIYWLSSTVRVVAIVLFAIFALIAIFEGVRMLNVVVTDMISIPAVAFAPNESEKGKYIFFALGATLFQLLNTALLLSLSYLLLKRLFPDFLNI